MLAPLRLALRDDWEAVSSEKRSFVGVNFTVV